MRARLVILLAAAGVACDFAPAPRSSDWAGPGESSGREAAKHLSPTALKPKPPPPPAPSVYTWTDASGEQHFTDNPAAIPERYRKRARVTEGDAIVVLPDAPSRARAVDELPRDGPTELRLLLFRADWCSACRALDRSGTIDRFASRNPEVPVQRVDVDDEEDLARRYGIRSIPTLVLVNESGRELARPSTRGGADAIERAVRTAIQ